MSRTKVKCCSCFVEQCVYFCEKKGDFTNLTSQNFDLFIKTTKEHCVLNGPLIYTEHVIACLDCFLFQLWNLSIEDIRIFDTVACRSTYSDPFNYGEEFHDDIFVGNNQFSRENSLLSRDEQEKIFRKTLNISDHFFRQPKHKSCFTSLQKQNFSHFCTECRNTYYKFFEKDLHTFWC